MNLRITQHQEFWNFFNSQIDLKDYRYKFLKQDIERIQAGTQYVYDDTFFNIEDEGWIMIMESDAILVYGKNWNSTQLVEVINSFDFVRRGNILLVGEPELIYALLDNGNFTNREIDLERVFYSATEIVDPTPGKEPIRLANINDAPILGAMLQQYYHEEYQGKNDKDLSEMILSMSQHIHNRSVYVLTSTQGEIASFCTIIDPDIGILFTNERFRNIGFGKRVLAYCSKLLLKKNNEVFLMTNKSKIESNEACRRIGYKNIYEYSYIRINNS